MLAICWQIVKKICLNKRKCMKTTENENAQEAQNTSGLEGNTKMKHISVAPMMDWTNFTNKSLKLNES